jgi:hypothetical protein
LSALAIIKKSSKYTVTLMSSLCKAAITGFISLSKK